MPTDNEAAALLVMVMVIALFGVDVAQLVLEWLNE